MKTFLPTEFTVGGHTYDLVVFHREGEDFVSGSTIVKRARELEAELGEEDALHILEHQSEIPARLRGKVHMVFLKWRSLDKEIVSYLHWDSGAWYRSSHLLDSLWNDCNRLVRRLS